MHAATQILNFKKGKYTKFRNKYTRSVLIQVARMCSQELCCAAMSSWREKKGKEEEGEKQV